jgi:quercetin dioxygenase-like cupin family protein
MGLKRLNTGLLMGLTLLIAACSPQDNPAAKALAISSADPSLAWGPCPPIFPEGCTIAVLHGDPTKPNADVFLRVPPQYVIPPHWHSSAERMVLVTGQLKVTYQGEAAALLEAGHYAYGPAKKPHQAECMSSDPCTLFIAFEGAVDAHAHEGGLD